jgi:ABC-type polysaccharide/polyol phosphate export permease
MVHGFEMVRAGYFGLAATTYFDATYLVVWNTALLLIGLLVIRAVREIEVD